MIGATLSDLGIPALRRHSTGPDGRVEPLRDWQAAGRLLLDDAGRPVIAWATCGTCGRSWNDALITSRTPVPSARCPFEYEHDDDDDDD